MRSKILCTGRQKGGRELDRSQYAEAVKSITGTIKITALYKRQEINEHIFGTIKRKWNYYYTDLKEVGESQRRIFVDYVGV
ncbi:MAG: hypothetical protein U0T77_12595 [Chitinophagales bacterium]